MKHVIILAYYYRQMYEKLWTDYSGAAVKLYKSLEHTTCV
jgi:hypothetical protein